MLPLVSLALALAPELSRFVFGDRAAPTEAAVTELVRGVTGTADPEAARAVLGRDPAMSDTLRLGLARLAAQADQDARAAELEALRAGLAATPRDQPGPIGRAGVGPAVVSIAVLAIFALVLWLAMTRSLPAGAETMVNLLLGSLAAMASSVVAYWVGSSAGSAAKTDLLFRSQPAGPAVGGR